MHTARAIEAVIFDMDGVLIDSEPFWQASELDVFGQQGLNLTPEQTHETIGLRIDEVVRYWMKRRPGFTPRPSVEHVAEAIVRGVAERVRAQGEPLPGVHSAIETLRAEGVRIGLATSSSPLLIDAVLDRLGIADAFEVTASAQDETHGKPHPAVYMTAAERLGVAPTACLAIEDSLMGLISAKAARMRCLVVPDPNLRGDPRLALADASAERLDGIERAAWRGLLA